MSDKTAPLPGAVVYAKDVQRLAAFYAQVAALRTVHSAADHVLLQGHGFQLVVHAIPNAIARDIHIATPPALREDTAIKLSLPVADLAAARALAATLGGGLRGPEAEWRYDGAVGCNGHDPEGNVLLLQAPAP
jgi:predicted enzyme related to lactoylglutathione lyase